MINFLDAHCHLADERIFSNLEEEIAKANQVGVSHFISSALCQEEFEWHQNNSFPGMFWTAGIHPYYNKTDEQDFQRLIKLCDEKKIIAVGEIGLDNRKDNFDWQKRTLLMQLDLAMNYDLPVVFHTVKQYYELNKILKNNFPKIRGFLHAFNASNEIFEEFSKYDLAFSMNAKPLKDNIIRKVIKRGFYLFETDAPFMRSRELKEDFNHLKNLMWPVDKISRITNIKKQELAAMQHKSFEQIFGFKLKDY